MYSGDPQNEYASSSDVILGLAKPKSANFKKPFSSNKIFSGFISRYKTWFSCKNYTATHT